MDADSPRPPPALIFFTVSLRLCRAQVVKYRRENSRQDGHRVHAALEGGPQPEPHGQGQRNVDDGRRQQTVQARRHRRDEGTIMIQQYISWNRRFVLYCVSGTLDRLVFLLNEQKKKWFFVCFCFCFMAAVFFYDSIKKKEMDKVGDFFLVLTVYAFCFYYHRKSSISSTIQEPMYHSRVKKQSYLFMNLYGDASYFHGID